MLFPIFACLTLGLAPVVPEPHFFEKVRWLVQGKPFAPVDVFDIIMHGVPWVWLGYSVITLIRRHSDPASAARQ